MIPSPRLLLVAITRIKADYDERADKRSRIPLIDPISDNCEPEFFYIESNILRIYIHRTPNLYKFFYTFKYYKFSNFKSETNKFLRN